MILPRDVVDHLLDPSESPARPAKTGRPLHDLVRFSFEDGDPETGAVVGSGAVLKGRVVGRKLPLDVFAVRPEVERNAAHAERNAEERRAAFPNPGDDRVDVGLHPSRPPDGADSAGEACGRDSRPVSLRLRVNRSKAQRTVSLAASTPVASKRPRNPPRALAS